MKTLFFSLVCLCWIVQSNAQAPASFYKNENLNKFIGTWEWHSNKDTLTLTCKKLTVVNMSGKDIDIICVWHKFVKNGLIIENTLPFISASEPTIESQYFAEGTMKGGANKYPNDLSLHVLDKNKDKNGDLILSYQMNDSKETLLWKLRNEEAVHIGPFDASFTYPTDLVLEKK